MNPRIWTLAAAAASTLAAQASLAQTARQTQGPTPWANLDHEPPPKIVVDPPLAEPLTHGAVVLQYRLENFRVAAAVGPAAAKVTPRIGHLHVTVDNLPWHWADAGESQTIIVAGLPPGPHSVRLELADPEHNEITGQTVKFTVPKSPAH